MNQPAIRIENISKRYRLGETHEHTLSDQVVRLARRLRGRAATTAFAPREFWALRDVSLDIAAGETFGIIGGNGAGKSTLLKILSRITQPTAGRVVVRGRMSSLLEVGTGFHPELSGRDNVFLNGTILGMRRAEVARKFDEIVEFSGVEKFIDTPVKRYSSGMYVRLAFAVAAHLEPDILVVDEVLAVGDAAFQKRCLGKMGDVARDGRTVLFVSHNMSAIQSMCSRVAWLKEGAIAGIGDPGEMIEAHLSRSDVRQDEAGGSQRSGYLFRRGKEAPGDKDAELATLQMKDSRGNVLTRLKTWDDVTFDVTFRTRRVFSSIAVELIFKTADGTPILRTSTSPDHGMVLAVERGRYRIACRFGQLPLAAGEYQLSLWLAVPRLEVIARYDPVCQLTVEANDVFSSGFPPISKRCPVVVPHSWSELGPGGEEPQ